VTWPQRGQDFAAALGGAGCACSVSAGQVCEYAAQKTYVNACRASCAGATTAQLITGPCAAYEKARCSLLDARSCVYRKRGRVADRTHEPVVRF